MYPVLILRSELVCLVILVFLYFTSRSYNIDKQSKAFNRILLFAIIHVVFDAITVLTVNHLDVVPEWINWCCHIIFYLSAILFSNEIANYVLAICYPQKARFFYYVGHTLMLIYILCLSFLKIEYVADVGTNSSYGPAAIVGYGLAFVFFLTALIIIFTHMNKLPSSLKNALIPMMLVLMVTEICQIIWKCVLFTGGAVTIVTVGFFFSLENPVAVFRKKAMTDALTGVFSRSSYEEDIKKFDKQFTRRPSDNYIFVFCDINDLRNVNNRFGHTEGDNYITNIATELNRCMKHATAIYRIGGDEFLILYYKINESIVESELKELYDECSVLSKGMEYTVAVSAGYAKSSSSYRSLVDVVKSADYAMYQNKVRRINNSAHGSFSFGTKLNLSGLTDPTFEIICASNYRSYPFITNLDTNVTRIAPGWKEYFELDNEFFFDFISIWKDRIHPDYLNGYMDDVVAVINGHRKYHRYDYLARKADGEYVKVSCYGSIYRDNSTSVSYFSGFIVNHGVDQNIDQVTGLQNFDTLVSNVCKYMDDKRSFSIMKLIINNLASINMLYGYSGGKEVLHRIGEILCEELESSGKVYCQDSSNFTILFETSDRQTLDTFYKKISELFSSGISTEACTVPILISGGAYINNGTAHDIERLRGSLAFAVEESHYSQRNNLVFYREKDSMVSGGNISLLAEIHEDALFEMKYFQLRYQPIVDIQSGHTVGAEALLRWIHPVYGEISPNEFISFIENDPCYYHLGLGIMQQAIKDAKNLQNKIPDFRINVNITALQLQNEHFADDISEIIDRFNYSPGDLILELTERCKEMDGNFLSKKIAELRERGIQIAFDDLGTGYSTISLLMDNPVDEIKLDKDFVKALLNRPSYQFFVKSLVLGSSSSANKYNICFEGIENEEILNSVKHYGNFLAQGYLYSRPLLFEDFCNYIDKECNP